MTKKLLQFVDLEQETPLKRKTSKRREDFKEIYDDFISGKANEQSSRCSQCGVPFCQIHCPLSNNIPDWLKLTAEGSYKRPTRFHKVQIICQKFVGEFVLKIDYAKGIVLLSSRDMERLR